MTFLFKSFRERRQKIPAACWLIFLSPSAAADSPALSHPFSLPKMLPYFGQPASAAPAFSLLPASAADLSARESEAALLMARGAKLALSTRQLHDVEVCHTAELNGATLLTHIMLHI